MAKKDLSDYDRRVIELIDVVAKTETADAAQAKEMFNLYNEKFLPRESGLHCTGCRSRVFRRLNEYRKTIQNG